MRRARLKAHFCSLLAIALLVATSQYLSHFHVPRGDVAAAAAHLNAGFETDGSGHAADEHCTLCLQFDRLPAPPTPMVEPTALFVFLAIVEAERLERLALDTPHLWPPSRGPPLA
ncbi:MAG: hypothetical protein H7Y89_11130 [Steroidobacteraceae bacterium]|nr:hypothetical protein [Steroidobacteraceae bacterium]